MKPDYPDPAPLRRHLRVVRNAALVLGLVLLKQHGVLRAEESRTEISFVRDIVPVLTKAGCNAGVCHAKAGGGQNGFQLSLLGFEPAEDYESILKDARGRRIFPAAPNESLLLQKASGATPHGGGIRLPSDSEGYRILRDWIAQGSPFRLNNEPTLTALNVTPSSGIIQRGTTRQLKAVAVYSDGSQRDVTTTALFESNDDGLAEVTEDGLVRVSNIPGRVAVMVRYGGMTTVFAGSVPLGQEVTELPAPNNFVDEYVFENLRQLGIPASSPCDDAAFLRRVTLDIAGRLPTAQEAAAFLESHDADKRDQLIERLLRSPGYADYFANKWTSLLKNRRDEASDITSNFAFHAWIRDSLLTNVPYDQLVRELLAATGTVVSNPPVAWYKRVKEPKEQLEDVAQLFLGVRLQCAQCHHHPFERWSQDDYYSFAAFFTQIGRKPTGIRGEDLIFHSRGIATAKNVRSGADLRPAALGTDIGDISADEDPRLRLAEWMSSPENPFFARAVVNRYWKHFFRRGLIEPEDDIRDTNPPTNPELLAALEKHFIESGFDLKDLVRILTRSAAYQLSSEPNEHNLADRQNYSRYYPRRLQAEVILDAIDDLTGSRTSFANLPPGTRAVALPDNSYNKSSQFLQVFGRPNSQSVCECERVQASSLAQSLHLINSGEIRSKLGDAAARANTLVTDERRPEEIVDELYLLAFSRQPTETERSTAVHYLTEPLTTDDGTTLDEKTALRRNTQDLIWALMNSKEFLFNH